MNVQLIITFIFCETLRCECNENLLRVLAKLNYDKKLRATTSLGMRECRTRSNKNIIN